MIVTHDPTQEDPPRIDANLKRCLRKEHKPVIIPAVETEKIEVIPGDPTKKVSIGAGLESVFKEGLISILREYADIFAWSQNDMPGLDESLAIHLLNVDPDKTPKIQK